MFKNKFTEQDKEKFIEYLNYIAKYANFNVKTNELINYYKLLSYMQQNLLNKINDNILEIKKISENKEE